MKLKITSTYSYHQAMLTISHLSNKGEGNLTPVEYKKLIALCKASERYQLGTIVHDCDIHEVQTTSSSFVSALYYSIFEFVSAVNWNYKDKKLRLTRLILKWARFVEIAELSAGRNLK
jgi:hypothetical protein